jgi:DNA polymerase elongation subunit (family B)
VDADGAPRGDGAADPAGADAPTDADVALFGKDPMPRLVDVQPLMDRPSDEPARVRLYQRSEDFQEVVPHEDRLFPFFFVSDVTLLRGRRSTFNYQRLEGDNFYQHLVVFNTWSDYWDAVRTIERRTDSEDSRPDELYLAGSPATQYMMQTGRTCFLDMTLDDLHRLQLDIEVYSEGGFPSADRPEDEIIIVALSDNRGWDEVLHLRDGIGEKQLLEELTHVLRERDPDVIEGHNCFPPGTPVLTPEGYRPIEDLDIGDAVLSRGEDGLTEDVVTETFATPHSDDLVTLHATYRGPVTSTADHPHYGYRKGEGIGYHAADTFEAGDYLAVPQPDLSPDDLVLDERLYLAGLIFADGHLSKATNRITFGNTDRDLVEWVASRLDGQGTIVRREGNERHADLHRLRTHDANAHAWLRSVGVPAGNKSTLDAPVAVERVAEDGPSGIASFLAGLIDGDGHVSEANGHVSVAVRSRRGRRAVHTLAQHLGLVTSDNESGVIFWPTERATPVLDKILSWLRLDAKRSTSPHTRRRRPDELPFVVIEKVRPFIKKLGLQYDDFPVPTTTVNYYLNGRTSINRETFARFESTIDDAVPPSLRPAWTAVQRELEEIKAFHWYPIRRSTTAPFEGTVYNIETGNHNYVASGVLTHNCFSFDLDYILDRCQMHGVEFAIGRDGSVPRQYDSSMRFAERMVDYPAVDIAGRHVIDTYFQVMAFDVFKRDMPDYSLKTAAKYFGFAPEDRTYIEGEDIARAWREDREHLLDYALDDVVETRRLAGHLSGSSFYLTQMLPMTYGSSARRGPASKIESLFVREYLRKRRAIPRSDWGSQSMGGYTDIFVTGVVGPIVYADVESLYPSIMLNYDVQPEGDVLDLFPTLLERLTDLRLETKKDMQAAEDEEIESELDARQSSYKVLINCFSPDTEVVTVDGIKPVGDVEVGDRVYSLNPDTGEVEIKPVTDTQAQHYEGPMVKIENQHVDFLVTPNHRFLTQRFTSGTYTHLDWETAADMLGDRIRRRLPARGLSSENAPVSEQLAVAASSGRASSEPHDGAHRIQVNRTRGQRPTIKPRHRELVDYDGEIQCVTVADNHTVLAGRNRTFNWCGQSFYGVLGFGLSAFNDFEEADRVARTGQEILRQLIDEIKERGGTVIEVDTDGVLFVPPDGVRGEQEEIDFTVGLTEAMPEGIRVGFDGRFQQMLSYKKKNYALLTYDDVLKFKGSSLISRSNEAFGRRFVRKAIRRLLDRDIEGLHRLYVETRQNIIESDWEGVHSFARTENLKDSVEQYEADVESGQRPRAAAYELAKQRAEETGQPVRKGDRIRYYITGEDANVTAFKQSKLADAWDPEDPDENTAYYLKRLDQFARKFEPFFSDYDEDGALVDDSDFRLIFSEEDLFGFSPEGIEIRTRHHEPDQPTDDHADEVPF